MIDRRLDLPARAARRGARDHARGQPRSRGAAPATSRPAPSPSRSSPRVVAFVDAARRARRTTARTSRPRWTLAHGRAASTSACAILVDPLSVFMMLIVSGVGMLIVAYSIGYMDGDDEERRYFAYMALFVFSMLLLVQGGNLLHAARRLGPGRPLLLPADRLLARAAERGRRGQEGVRDERDRRRDDGARALPADPADGLAQLRDRLRAAPARSSDWSRTSSRSACSAARSPSRRSCRSRRGFRTRWRARRRSAPSSTPRRW